MSSHYITTVNAAYTLQWLLTRLAAGETFSPDVLQQWAQEVRLVMRMPRFAASPAPDYEHWSDSERIAWADEALLDLCAAIGRDRSDALTHLLCSLKHWAVATGDNFEASVALAQMEYESRR